MRRKVGIVTFHRSRNYGAVLQTYALQNVLSSMGIDSEVIDYQNRKIAEDLKLWNKPKKIDLKQIICSILQFLYRFRKKTAFDKFINNNINLSKMKDQKNINANCQYDLFITGSDQVWNKNLTDNDGTYYLDFVPKETPKVAYAVSAGDSLQVDHKRIERAVEDFVSISVREEILRNFLQTEYRYNAKICCDPTLLVETRSFEKMIKTKRCKNKYIFLYMIQDCNELYEKAERLAKENGLSLVSNKNCFSFFKNCSPIDFLNWIYYAEYIITNSFHGTCFSLHFEKNFIVDVEKRGRMKNQRVIDLLENLNMRNKLIMHSENLNVIRKKLMNKVDYCEVKHCIEVMRVESLEWLNDVVK